MANSKDIVKFIKDCFEEYSLNFREIFYYAFNGYLPEEIEWTDQNGQISPRIVSHASEILGLNPEDITSANKDAMDKWFKKYPYYGLVPPFKFAYERTFYGDGFDEIRLFETIFEIKSDLKYPPRFDYRDIISRMIAKLKEIDKSIPGTYHNGANITKLQIDTENFCHFDEIKTMTECFITMVQRAMELFIQAVDSSLSQEEKNEYNLLVSTLGIRDRFYTKGYLYYDSLIKVKELYQGITKENFFDEIILRRGREFKPWRCVEFVLDRELVERYLSVMPEAKSKMREFAVAVSQFKCFFTWSDAKPIQFSPDEEEELKEMDEILGEDPIPLEQRAKEATEIYVEKNSAELNGDDATADRLISYCRPAKLGGLKVKTIKQDNSEWLRHVNFLLGNVPSNNFIERVTEEINKKEGGQHE